MTALHTSSSVGPARRRRRSDGWERGVRYSWRRLVVLVLLTPLMALLAVQLPRLGSGSVLVV